MKAATREQLRSARRKVSDAISAMEKLAKDFERRPTDAKYEELLHLYREYGTWLMTWDSHAIAMLIINYKEKKK